MTDDEIKERIRDYFQIQLDNLSYTDKLNELLEQDDPDGGPDYDRANVLMIGEPRIRIEWSA